MKKYTLLHVGTPRTGTTSLWKMLRKHEDITVSKVKEPIWQWDKNIDHYLDWFDIKDGTKVLVDCTPITILLAYQRRYFRDISKLNKITRRCCLYTLRSDPIRRIKSYMESLSADYYLRKRHSALIVDGEISFKGLEFITYTYINDAAIIRMNHQFFGESNVFIVKLEEFNDRLSELYQFLGISQNSNILLEHYKNRADFEDSLDYVRYLKAVKIANDYIDERMDELNFIVAKSKMEMKLQYGIE
jgi:hypothetical protein